jgi:hypothetical protein
MKCERRLRSEMLDNEGSDGYHHRLTNVNKSVEGMFCCLSISHRLCRHDVNLHRSTSSPYVPGRFECSHEFALGHDDDILVKNFSIRAQFEHVIMQIFDTPTIRCVVSNRQNFNFSLPYSSHQPVSIKDDVKIERDISGIDNFTFSIFLIIKNNTTRNQFLL